MNFLEQNLISLDLIAFLCSDGWEVELNEVCHGMSSLSKTPIKCVKSTAKINYLTFILGFLEMLIILSFYMKEKGHGHYEIKIFADLL